MVVVGGLPFGTGEGPAFRTASRARATCSPAGTDGPGTGRVIGGWVGGALTHPVKDTMVALTCFEAGGHQPGFIF